MNRKGAFVAAVALGLVLGAVLAIFTGGKGYAPSTATPTLAEETIRLEAELPLAATKKPYLVLDLLTSRLDYRLSGMTIKSLPFQIDSIREKGKESRPAHGKVAVLVIQDRGAPVEVIIPPDPDQEVDPLEDPKLFPPDPPTDFTLLFDRPFKVRFLGEREGGWKGTVKGVGRTVKEWLPWGPGGGRKETRVQLRLPAERAQEIYRALYHGEKVLVMGLEDAAKQ